MLRCRGPRGILLLLLGSLVLWSLPNFVVLPGHGNRGQRGRPFSDSALPALPALADPEVGKGFDGDKWDITRRNMGTNEPIILG